MIDIDSILTIAKEKDASDVHLICGRTTEADEHCHRFEFTTQVDSPLI